MMTRMAQAQARIESNYGMCRRLMLLRSSLKIWFQEMNQIQAQVILRTQAQAMNMNFTADSGQTVYFQVVEPPQTNDSINWVVFDEVDNAIFDTCLQCGDPGLITLDHGGTYTIYVGNQSGAGTGTYQFRIWDVPPPDEFTMDIGDRIARDIPGPGAGFIEKPGSHDIYTFTAEAGQEVTFRGHRTTPQLGHGWLAAGG